MSRFEGHGLGQRPAVGESDGFLVSLYYHCQLVNKLLIPDEILDFLNKSAKKKSELIEAALMDY